MLLAQRTLPRFSPQAAARKQPFGVRKARRIPRPHTRPSEPGLLLVAEVADVLKRVQRQAQHGLIFQNNHVFSVNAKVCFRRGHIKGIQKLFMALPRSGAPKDSFARSDFAKRRKANVCKGAGAAALMLLYFWGMLPVVAACIRIKNACTFSRRAGVSGTSSRLRVSP